MTQNLRHTFRRIRVVHSQGPVLLLAVFIGVIGGLGAVGFHSLLHYFQEFILGDISGLSLFGHEAQQPLVPRWLFFLVPATGGLISGWIVFKFAPETQGHGTDAMINTFHNKGGRVRKRVPPIKAITSILTISSGGSAGYEGPVAQIGSGLGALIARAFKISVRFRRNLTLAGTAAGLGAIFKAPLGGALTSVEVLYKEDFESDAFLSSIIASVVGYATYAGFMGYAPFFQQFGYFPEFIAENPIELGLYALFGVVLAPLSLAYVRVFYFIRDQFRGLPVPNWTKPAIGGLGVGFLFYIQPNIIAGGWQFLVECVRSPHPSYLFALTLLSIALLKIIATSLTVGSGGSGGIFGPSLFIGGMIGGAFGVLCDQLFPTIVTHPGAFMIVGMGAFFSGAANAPIASVVMVCELTGNYNLLAPLMLAAVIHVYLARKWSIYESQVLNKFHSKAHKSEIHVDILRSALVQDVLDLNRPIVRVHPEDSLKKLEKFMSETDEDLFIVENDDGKMVGILDVHAIRKAIFDQSVSSLVIVEDMMESPKYLGQSMDLHAASQYFLKTGISQLPVVNHAKEVLATLKHADVIQSYDTLIRKGKLSNDPPEGVV